MEKIKAFWNLLTTNPMALIKWVLQSADHTDNGASQKKLTGYWFVILITFLDVCYWKYQLRIHIFDNFTLVWVLHASVFGTLIGINFAFEKFLKNPNQDNQPPK